LKIKHLCEGTDRAFAVSKKKNNFFLKKVEKKLDTKEKMLYLCIGNNNKQTKK
jgi:hypothetical protein